MTLKVPPGLDQAVLRVLMRYRGRANAVHRTDILHALELAGWTINDRMLRHTINELRKQGHLICAAASRDGGYFIAADRQEVDDFIRAEIDSRLSDLSETRRRLTASARQRFGEGVQMRLV